MTVPGAPRMPDELPAAVFGYGSLVNTATHALAPLRVARLPGWRRAWRYTAHRTGPYLTAVPSPGDAIDGLIAAVPPSDWPALDAREVGYLRRPTPWAGVVVYAVPAPQAQVPGGGPILLSYLDAVFQGFLRQFGPQGLADFIATTDGWEVGLRDDRAAPLYPRHQRLTPEERAQVDQALHALGLTPRG